LQGILTFGRKTKKNNILLFEIFVRSPPNDNMTFFGGTNHLLNFRRENNFLKTLSWEILKE
jgi:hypothetical protein